LLKAKHSLTKAPPILKAKYGIIYSKDTLVFPPPAFKLQISIFGRDVAMWKKAISKRKGVRRECGVAGTDFLKFKGFLHEEEKVALILT